MLPYKYIVAVAIALVQPTFGTQESPVADALFQSFELRCDSSTLRISGYGMRRPGRAPAIITLNGRPVRGEAIGRLRQDLSDVSAVYRLTGRCSGGSSDILLHVHRARPEANGDIRYTVGQAAIVRGRIIEYPGLEEASASSFWFR
jgi:hypothetical protein